MVKFEKLASPLRIALALAIALSAGGCNMFGFRSWTWHQKLTVSVKTPEGFKFASAVSEVWLQKNPRWWGIGDGAGASDSSVTGEAVVIDLGGRHFLFALPNRGYDSTAVKAFFPDPEKPRMWEEMEPLYDWLLTLRETREVPLKRYPRFVTFDDIENPASVKLVNPSDLEASFGPGYRLNQITIAVTDEPETEGTVEKVLPWLCSYKNDRLRLSGKTGPIGDNLLANNISGDDFSYGGCK
nr:hypothetical protein [uncultured Gellertiella sp.]